MFKDRSLQVKFVKQEKQPVTIENTYEFDKIIGTTIAQAADSTKDIIQFSAKMVAGYIALDTVRKVAVELVKNK